MSYIDIKTRKNYCKKVNKKFFDKTFYNIKIVKKFITKDIIFKKNYFLNLNLVIIEVHRNEFFVSAETEKEQKYFFLYVPKPKFGQIFKFCSCRN